MYLYRMFRRYCNTQVINKPACSSHQATLKQISLDATSAKLHASTSKLAFTLFPTNKLFIFHFLIPLQTNNVLYLTSCFHFLFLLLYNYSMTSDLENLFHNACTTDLHFFYLDTEPHIWIVFLSRSCQRAYLSEWREVPLNGVDVLLYRYVDTSTSQISRIVVQTN